MASPEVQIQNDSTTFQVEGDETGKDFSILPAFKFHSYSKKISEQSQQHLGESKGEKNISDAIASLISVVLGKKTAV